MIRGSLPSTSMLTCGRRRQRASLDQAVERLGALELAHYRLERLPARHGDAAELAVELPVTSEA